MVAEALLLLFLLRPRFGRPVRQFLVFFGFVAALSFTDFFPYPHRSRLFLLASVLIVIAINGLQRSLKIPIAFLLAGACLLGIATFIFSSSLPAALGMVLAIASGICFMVDLAPPDVAALAFYGVQAGWYTVWLARQNRSPDTLTPYRIWAEVGAGVLVFVALATRRLFEPERPAASEPRYRLPPTSYTTAAAICYALGPLAGLFMLEIPPYKRDRVVRFHAYQSMFLGLASFLIWSLSLLGIVALRPLIGRNSTIEKGAITLVSLSVVALFIFLSVEANHNRPRVLPGIGWLALRYGDRIPQSPTVPPPARESRQRSLPVRPGETPHRTAAALSYLLGPTGLLMLAIPRYRRDRTVRFHVWQSILLTVAYLAIYTVTTSTYSLGFISIFAPVISRPLLDVVLFIRPLLDVVLLGTWLVVIVQTWRNRPVLLPLIGRWALRLAGSSAPAPRSDIPA
jgi:uncharacterized membrane protein